MPYVSYLLYVSGKILPTFSMSHNFVIFFEDYMLVEYFYLNICYWHYKNVMGRKCSSNIEKGWFSCYFGKLWARLNSTNKHLVSTLKCSATWVNILMPRS